MLRIINGRMSLLQRLGLLSAVFIAVALVPLVQLDRKIADTVRTIRTERDGVGYLEAVWPVYLQAAKGEAPSAELTTALRARAARHDAAFGTADESKALLEAGDAQARQAAGHALIAAIVEGSRLLLDYDPTTYFLIDLATDELPVMADATQALAAAAAGGGRVTLDERLALSTAFADFKGAATGVEGALQTVADYDPARAASLRPAFQTFSAQAGIMEAASGAVNRRVAQDGTLGETATVVAQGRRALDRLDTAGRASLTALDVAFAARLAAERATQVWTMALSLLLMAAALAFAWLIATGLSARIGKLVGVMERLAERDTSVEVPFQSDRNETGRIAQAVQTFKEGQLERGLLRQQAEAAAVEAEAARKIGLMALAAQFETTVLDTVNALADASLQLESTAGTLSASAADAALESDTVAQAAEIASGNIQNVASATEELSASSQEIAGQATQVTTVAHLAGEKVGQTTVKVEALAQAVDRIGEVVRLISNIASQTNLLALNATIEAARAGEAGRGFAVVASEVKALASQTAQATAEIARQIAEVQAATGGAVEAIGSITRTIGDVNLIATSIAAAIEEQAAAVGEITRSTTQVAGNAADVVHAIEGVRRGSRSTGDGAKHSLYAAQDLGRQADRLRTEVTGFLDHVRAA